MPFTGSSPYFKSAPALSRKDTWPPNGGPPGSDLAFMQEQLLDRYGIDCGMLHLLSITGMDQRNQDFGAALCHAINHWQFNEWTQKDQRLKAAIVVPGEDAAAAVKEIEYWAGNPDFAQVSLVTHAIEPLGRRRYWPIYEAAVAHGLPIGLHSSGNNGHAVTPAGWPSYYAEEHHAVAISQQGLISSLVCEGVLARLPELRVVIVEAGLAWVPSLCWRLDQHWRRMRDEVPHLDRAPSSYVKSQIVVHHPADGRAGAAGGFGENPGMDRLGPHSVRDRLSALGFRRSGHRAEGEAERHAAADDLPRQCARGL